MNEQVGSLIRNVSNLGDEVLNQVAEAPFQWWGASPEQARKTMVNKPKGLVDKRTTLKEAVQKYIKDGINIGLGGFVNTRPPVAIVHEIIRQGAKDLTLSFQSNSVCPELLAGAMLAYPEHLSIRRVELAWWGYEVIGIAPLLRHLCANGMIKLDDYTNYGMTARFKAAAMGLEFIPVRDHGGSDMELVNRGCMVQSPFTAECLPGTGMLSGCGHPERNCRGYVRQLPDFRRPLYLSGNCHGGLPPIATGNRSSPTRTSAPIQT